MTVYLVGAGPGDPGLITARALELIAAADVIVYDRLIPACCARRGASRRDADLRRQGGRRAVDAAVRDLTAAGVARAVCVGVVVRLKGGDPFVFGRGGEEAEALRAAGVAFEVVPGVTAGVAGPAYAGIPVTHRDAASAVAFVTGHEDPLKASGSVWIGERSRRSPGRSCSTWESGSYRRSRRSLSWVVARRPSRPRWSSAGRCPTSGS